MQSGFPIESTFPEDSIEQVCEQLDHALETFFTTSEAHQIRLIGDRLSQECGRFHFHLSVDPSKLSEQEKLWIEQQNTLWEQSQPFIAPLLRSIQQNMNAVMRYAQDKIESGQTDYEYSKEFAQAIGVLWDKHNMLFEFLKLPGRFKAMKLDNGRLYYHDFREHFLMPVQDPQDIINPNTLGQYLLFQDLFYPQSPLDDQKDFVSPRPQSQLESQRSLFPDSNPDQSWARLMISETLICFDTECPIPSLEQRQAHAKALGLSTIYSGLIYSSNRFYERNILLITLAQSQTQTPITYHSSSRTYSVTGQWGLIDQISDQALYDVLVYLKDMPNLPLNRSLSSKANALYCESIISDLTEILQNMEEDNVLYPCLKETLEKFKQWSTEDRNCVEEIDSWFVNLSQNQDLAILIGFFAKRPLESQTQSLQIDEESREDDELLAQFDSIGARLMTQLNSLPIQALVCTHDPINHDSIDHCIKKDSFFIKKNDQPIPTTYQAQIFAQALAYACGENAYRRDRSSKLMYQLSHIPEKSLFWHMPEQQDWIAKACSFLGYPAHTSLQEIIRDLQASSANNTLPFLKEVEIALKDLSQEYESHSYNSHFSVPFLKQIDADIVAFLKESSQKSWEYYAQNEDHAIVYDRTVLERLNSFLKKREALLDYAIVHRMQKEWQKEAMELHRDYEIYKTEQLIKYRIPFKTPMILLSTVDYHAGQSLRASHELKKPLCEQQARSKWSLFWLSLKRFIKKNSIANRWHIVASRQKY